MIQSVGNTHLSFPCVSFGNTKVFVRKWRANTNLNYARIDGQHIELQILTQHKQITQLSIFINFKFYDQKNINDSIPSNGFYHFCHAQDITGKWTGKIMDQFDITYDFKVDGEKLTGTTNGPDGTIIPIKDGVIKGDSISFTIAMMGNDMKINGKIKSDTITLTLPGMGGDDPVNVLLKKAK